MDTATAAKVATSTIVGAALGAGLVQYSERRRQQLLADLQGGKTEGAATMATRARHGRFPWSQRNRGEWLEAMCLAAVFGDSGQSRNLLYAALSKAMASDESREQIKSSMADIQAIIARNSPYTDLTQVRHRLFALSAVLNVDDDLRMRVERAHAYSDQIDDMATPDERCTEEAHRWGALKKVLRERESVVVVCPRPGRDGFTAGCATLALDFHKVAQIGKQAPAAAPAAGTGTAQCTVAADERFLLTESAKRLHRAKYQRNATDISSIANELSGIIASHPAYEKAGMIAVVSGRSHDCSVQLGIQVAHLAAKNYITLARQNGCAAEPKFALTELDLVKGREIILVDDVYRTGATVRDAAQVLRNAGARQILGLTVTCTVSAIASQ
jgi:hypoxanthine-guanine phosphoribosyltransferase